MHARGVHYTALFEPALLLFTVCVLVVPAALLEAVAIAAYVSDEGRSK